MPFILLLCWALIAVSYRYFKNIAKDHPCKIIKKVGKIFFTRFWSYWFRRICSTLFKTSKNFATLPNKYCSIFENWTLKCVDIALHAHTSGDIESGGKNEKNSSKYNIVLNNSGCKKRKINIKKQSSFRRLDLEYVLFPSIAIFFTF